jgi:hypothetical protein
LATLLDYPCADRLPFTQTVGGLTSLPCRLCTSPVLLVLR